MSLCVCLPPPSSAYFHRLMDKPPRILAGFLPGSQLTYPPCSPHLSPQGQQPGSAGGVSPKLKNVSFSSTLHLTGLFPSTSVGADL